MPGYDGTGPMGMGPMTGGGRGFCVTPAAGIRPGPFGRRFFGRGGGRGRRNMYYATGLPGWARPGDGYAASGMRYMPAFSKEAEAQTLREEAAMLKEELGVIEERLAAFEKVQGQKDDADR